MSDNFKKITLNKNFDESLIRDAYLYACHKDIEAIKPGNVNINSPHHDTTASDYLISSINSGSELFNDSYSLGDRILSAIVATKKETLSKYDQLGLDTFNEVTSETDFTIGPDIKKWRTAFYSTHTGSNKAQNKAFSRCRENLIERGYLTLENDIYSLGDIET